MIKANELRVGNIVSAPVLPRSENKCYHVITNIGDNYACMINLPDGFSQLMPFEDIEPIPLTGEILWKCGFFNDGSYFSIKIGECYLTIDKYDFSWTIGISYEANGTFLKIKYLHQLQNLYFAMSGEELNFKP